MILKILLIIGVSIITLPNCWAADRAVDEVATGISQLSLDEKKECVDDLSDDFTNPNLDSKLPCPPAPRKGKRDFYNWDTKRWERASATPNNRVSFRSTRRLVL